MTTIKEIKPVSVGAGVLAVLLIVTVVWLVVPGLDERDPDGDRAGPAPRTDCKQVTLLTGQKSTPYYKYALTLKGLLEGAGRDWKVTVQDTKGSVENLNLLKAKNDEQTPRQDASGKRMIPAPPCMFAIVQMNVAVDAVKGRYLFMRDSQGVVHAVEGLRTVGQVYYDLMHVMVRDESEIKGVDNLCGMRVAKGLPGSGVEQLAKMLEDTLSEGGKKCIFAGFDGDMVTAMDRLCEKKDVDVVLWAAGVPTEQVKDHVRCKDGSYIRFLPMHDPAVAKNDFLAKFNIGRNNFFKNYPPFYGGDVFTPAKIFPKDYFPEGLGRQATPTFRVANAFVALVGEDKELVRFATKALYEKREQFEYDLRSRPAVIPPADYGTDVVTFPDKDQIFEDPTFCYVPPHPAVLSYYEEEPGDLEISCATRD
jgi:TRAP transporter TAXI family solute receptor